MVSLAATEILCYLSVCTMIIFSIFFLSVRLYCPRNCQRDSQARVIGSKFYSDVRICTLVTKLRTSHRTLFFLDIGRLPKYCTLLLLFRSPLLIDNNNNWHVIHLLAVGLIVNLVHHHTNTMAFIPSCRNPVSAVRPFTLE